MGVKHFKYWIPKDGDVYVDVGASTGQTIFELRNFFKERIRIIAIEANPEACKILRQREPDITIIQKGAWFEKGKAWFSSPERDTVHGQVTIDESEAKLPQRELVSIDVDTLDNILKDEGLSSANFVKIDVEGNEPAVLRGFRTVKIGTKFHIEWHMNLDAVLKELENLGIEVIELIKWNDETYKGEYGEIFAEKKCKRFKVAVIGIGNVGLPFAAVAASAHEVTGIDIRDEWIQALKNGFKLSEPRLENYLSLYRLKLSSDLSDVKDKDLIFIVVGSQSSAYGPESIMKALEGLKPFLNGQTIVITSTLLPGSIREKIIPFILKEEIHKLIGGLCYSPVFVALGTAVKYFESPGYLPIGTEDERTAGKVKDFYLAINKETKFFFTSFESAEVMKYATNLALINKISLLNTLTEYCEAYGAKIDEVVSVFKEDPRIAGTKMFKGGLGFGGTCFPLDARAFKQSQVNKNLDTCLVDSIMRINEHQIERIVKMIEWMPEKTVSILGITYKENTGVVAESQALEIANRLRSKKNVTVYDPVGMENARKVSPEYLEPGSGTIPVGRLEYAPTLEAAIEASEILVFAVEWEEFKKTDLDFGDKIVIDPWRMFKDRKIKRWIPFGQN